MNVYPAIIEKATSQYIVTFPDIPEAMTQGETLEEAYVKGSEVLGAVLEDYASYPLPSSFEEIDAQHPGKIVTLIGVDMVAFRRKYHSKAIRKNVTVPEWIAELAEAENINFSQTLTEALKNKLGIS